MKKCLIILGLLAISAQADLWIIQDKRTGAVWTNAVGDATLVDYGRGAAWQAYTNRAGWITPVAGMPAVVDDETWSVSYALSIPAALADHAASLSPARKALRQYLGEKPTKKAIRQAKRQAERGWTTSSTFAIYLRARTNELHMLKLIEDFQDEVEVAK
jgi:hypothetical protein